MFSSERQPLKSGTDEKAQRALADLSRSLGDEESSYLSRGPPSGHPTTLGSKIARELKQNWWLWGSVAFAVLLIGSLVVFRNSLYDTAAHGLPFLAVKENAAEACATQCKEEQNSAQLAVAGNAGDQNTPMKEAYDTCYTKCVAQETKEVAEEREKFKQSEEDLEKMVEDKEAGEARKSGAGNPKQP